MIPFRIVLIYCVGMAMVGSVASLAYRFRRRDIPVPGWMLYAVGVGALYLLVFQILKLHAMHDYGDMSVVLEMTSNVARGHGPVSSLQESMIPGHSHWFSNHFTPFIYLFGGLFRILPWPETLLWAQFLLLVVGSALAAFVYARRRLGGARAGAIAGAILILHPTMQYIALYEFEYLRFCIPLIIALFWALETGRGALYWVSLVGCLLCREEVALTLILIGAYVALTDRSKRAQGILTSGISTLYFLAVTQVVMPRFRSGATSIHVASFWFAEFGDSWGSILIGILMHPLKAMGVVLQPVKMANLAMYLLPFGFLPLLCWGLLLAGAGNWGLNALSGSITHTSFFLYYLSPSLALMFVAWVQAVDRLSLRSAQRYGERLNALLASSFAAAFMATVFFGPSPISLTFWFRAYQLAPFRTHSFHRSHYTVTEHRSTGKRLLRSIPRDSVVSAEQPLLPWLYDCRGLKVFPDIQGADVVAIDKDDPIKSGVATVPDSWDGLRKNPQYYYDWVEKDPSWELLASEDGYYIYRKKRPS